MQNIRELLKRAKNAEDEADELLSLAAAAAVTGEPLATLKRWAYRDKVLPIEHVGPTRRVRVRLSVIRRFFPGRRIA